MRKIAHRSAVVVLLVMMASLLGALAPGTVYAAESMPSLHWQAMTADNTIHPIAVSPQGQATIGCDSAHGQPVQNLTTYDNNGQVVRQLLRSEVIDDRNNCITTPVVDKNGDLYGMPYSKRVSTGSSWGYGANLLAYDGNTLKWKYPVNCTYNNSQPTVGADGNIYVINSSGHLVGLTPEVEPGTTQPEKVLDVDIDGGCGHTLFAYKHGLVAIDRYANDPTYYSYAGKKLGPSPSDSYYGQTRTPINAEGYFFDSVYTPQVNGRNVSVSVHDPRRGEVVWTTQASTEGADVQTTRIYVTSDGGVVAVMREQKTHLGVPTVPEEYVTTLAKISGVGVKEWSMTLPNEDSSGNEYGSVSVVADTTGKLVVMRELAIQLDDYPYSVPGIDIGVLDVANGNILHNEEIRGNTDGNDGARYGYWLEESGNQEELATGQNALYIYTGKCAGVYCTPNETTLRAVDIPGLGMDYPRGAVLAANTAAQPAPKEYVALGDSFSSATGVPPYLDDTACLRSSRAYSRVLGLDPSSSLQLVDFVACSGAQTMDVLNSWNDTDHSEPPQVNALWSHDPDVVSITIGGNDIKFDDFAEACVLRSCNFDSLEYNASKNAIDTVLSGRLEDVYEKLLEATETSGADIYILGYPQIIAYHTATDPIDARCYYMYDSSPHHESRFWEDAQAARDLVIRLNAKIEAKVNDVRAMNAGNQRLHFVSATGNNSPFNGHELCSTGEPFFQNLDEGASNSANVFHPNWKGQAAYATVLRQAMGE